MAGCVFRTCSVQANPLSEMTVSNVQTVVKKTTRVKICGITSVEDALAATNAGADAIGLVFYEPSPRYVSIDQAAKIAKTVGPFVTTVALFVNADKKIIDSVLQQVPISLLQFHGDETAAFCEQFARPYIKALRMRDDIDVNKSISSYTGATGILLDAYAPGVPGGTGETFDWQRIPKNTAVPIVLAGGLTPKNIQTAVGQTAVYGVDVSGGVECAPGIKDAIKIQEFIQRANSG